MTQYTVPSWETPFIWISDIVLTPGSGAATQSYETIKSSNFKESNDYTQKIEWDTVSVRYKTSPEYIRIEHYSSSVYAYIDLTDHPDTKKAVGVTSRIYIINTETNVSKYIEIYVPITSNENNVTYHKAPGELGADGMEFLISAYFEAEKDDTYYSRYFYVNLKNPNKKTFDVNYKMNASFKFVYKNI